MISKIKSIFFKIALWQFLAIAGLALILFFIQGLQAATSSLLGGCAYWIPSSAFIASLLTKKNLFSPSQFLIAFMAGEAAKLISSVILFILMINYLHVSLPLMMTGFCVAIFSFWVISFILFSNKEIKI